MAENKSTPKKDSAAKELTNAQKLENAAKYVAKLEKDLGEGHALKLTHSYAREHANGIISAPDEETLHPSAE